MPGCQRQKPSSTGFSQVLSLIFWSNLGACLLPRDIPVWLIIKAVFLEKTPMGPMAWITPGTLLGTVEVC